MGERNMISRGTALVVTFVALITVPGCGMITSGLALLSPGPEPVPVVRSRTVYVSRAQAEEERVDVITGVPEAEQTVFELDAVGGASIEEVTEAPSVDDRRKTGTTDLKSMSGGIEGALAQLEAIVEQSMAMRGAMLRARVGTPARGPGPSDARRQDAAGSAPLPRPGGPPKTRKKRGTSKW